MKNRIDPQQPFGAEIRRIAAEEIATAISGLEAARDKPESGFHETRKSLKRLRALLRLVASSDRPFWREQNIRFRDIARGLADAREAAALVETVDWLGKNPSRQDHDVNLAAVRQALVERRDRITGDAISRDRKIDEAIVALKAGGEAIANRVLPDDPRQALAIVARGASDAMRRGARALKRARRRSRQDDFHELRKATKNHGAHLALLASFWPKPVDKRRDKFDQLSQHLGELNDLFVLRQTIRRREGDLVPDDGDIRLLRGLLRQDVKKLRRQCLKQADDLFDMRPSRLRRKLLRQM